MAQRVFIKVIGFSDVERHALNTLFRLSEQGPTWYLLWTPDAPEPAQLVLADGLDPASEAEAEIAVEQGLKLVWVGDGAPDAAWRVFQRPLAWSEVVQAMDQHFAAQAPLDFDLDFGDTAPPQAPARRVLIAAGDREERLYLRARLALAELTCADEAETAAQALELVRQHRYELALLDFGLPGAQGWALLKQLARAQPAIPHLIVTKQAARWPDGLWARWCGARAFLPKPADPARLQQLLSRCG